ncbi:hypothetical protein [Pseudomonas sp. YL-218 TE3947]|uniref:hypothetical protein n=1 Tax=Pseudomonas TaxID=286 RepID=UPI003D24859A
MINKERAALYASGAASKYVEIQHAHFMKKVVTTLGETAASNFCGSYIGKDSTSRPMYIFPKREATLMAMSFNACRTLKCVRLKQGVALIKRDL